jgi:beta-glucosidase
MVLGRFVVVLAIVLVAALASAPARGPERRCQQAISETGRRLFDASLTNLASCKRALARGTLPAGTDCAAARGTIRKQASAKADAGRDLRRACSDAEVVSLAPAGACAGIRTVAGLTTCLAGSNAAGAEALLAVADAAHGSLPRTARRCAAHASLLVRRFALERVRLIQRCKSGPAHLRLPAAGTCATEPDTQRRIARRRTHAEAGIAAVCSQGALSATPFGAPCDAAASGDALAECLLVQADAAADEAISTEYRDPGFCGDSGDAVEQRIAALVAEMTLAQKLDQMHGSKLGAGGWRTPDDPVPGIPGFGMIDGSRGVGVFAGGHATTFPVASARGATWDPALEERVGEAIGAEARAKGASVLLAPVVNILRHPRWGRAQETYGEDTLHLGEMGAGFVRGAQRHVIASAKHFALNSIEDTRLDVNVTVDERSLREVYLPHFRTLAQQAHVGSVMAAYNSVNGQYCAENVHLLHDILKGDWGFQGFVESDWIFAMHGTATSANAGLDIEMPVPNFYGPALASAVTAGTVSQAVIDDAVRRVLRAKLCFRLDTDPPVADPGVIESPSHLDVALEAEREGIVLLKNDRATLPLDRSKVRSIAVLGDLAATVNLGDHGSSDVSSSFAVTPLEGIQSQAPGVAVSDLSASTLTDADRAAVAAADAAIVVVGLTADDESEKVLTVGDRQSLDLSAAQNELVATVAVLNPRTIVVLEGGGAVTMPWVNDVSAVLMAWYPGQEGGRAIADVLFGDVNPSGKLPVTFPVSEADLPPFDDHSTEVTYGYLHGYRWVDRQGIAPLFPFGFGLSYTTFSYSNLTLERSTFSPAGRLRATVEVTNTGRVGGDEIAQLYVTYPGSRVERAVQDLKAFARVHLEPGETRTVAFEVRAADLAYWDVATGGWTVEPTTYGARVGGSSRDLPLEATFTIAEDAQP